MQLLILTLDSLLTILLIWTLWIYSRPMETVPYEQPQQEWYEFRITADPIMLDYLLAVEDDNKTITVIIHDKISI